MECYEIKIKYKEITSNYKIKETIFSKPVFGFQNFYKPVEWYKKA
jgi:hypothetical protein